MASSELARRRARVCGACAEVAMRWGTNSAVARLLVRTLVAVGSAAGSVCAKGTRALLTGTSLSRNGTLIGVFPVSRKRRAGPSLPSPQAGGEGGGDFQ